MCNDSQKNAHLRYSERTNQCDLRFTLIVNHEKYGSLREEIKSVRQATDNVASLIQHTKNKIKKLFQDKQWETAAEADFNISLNKGSKKLNFEPINGEVTCQELLLFKGMQFRIMGESYSVIVNAPLLISLTLPKVMYVDTILRPQIKGLFLCPLRSSITWSKSRDKNKWIEVGSKFQFKPKQDHIGYYLKVVYKPFNKNGIGGDVVETISDDVVSILPKLALECITSRHQYTKSKLNNNRFRVVSYNILADRYTTDSQFPYVDSKYLSNPYRRSLLIHEILGYNADIICLQEMEHISYNEFFKGHLKASGFVTSFYKKGRVLNEGLGLMFDRSRFRRIDEKHVVLAKELNNNNLYKDIYAVLKRNKDLKELVLRQHTSLLLTALEWVSPANKKSVLVIANTHLFYHSEAGHVRLIQAVISKKCISQYCQDLEKIMRCKVAVIFCGDFNSLPNSGVYHYMVNNDLSNCTKELEQIGCTAELLQNNLKFESACGTPEFTNYTDTFKGCLDYIFYQKETMSVTQVVPFPPEEQMSTAVALPNQHFPSDHVALVTDFKL